MSIRRQLALARAALARASKGASKRAERLTLREFAEDPDFCGLTLSPVAGAILDAADGVPVRLTDGDCYKIFHCRAADLPDVPSKVIGVGAGRRGGKTSQIGAPGALHAAWYTPLRRRGAPVDPEFPNAQELAAGERPRVVILAAEKHLAKQAFELTIGLIRESPILSSALVDDPSTKHAVIRRPDGIEVEILVVAAKAQGTSARSGTLLALVMDEACFFRSEDGYAVTDTDTYDAAVPAVVEGGRIIIISTPWIEEYGLLERLIKEEWGKHKAALVAARIPSYVLNPKFDPMGSRERAIRTGPDGEETWRREVEAIPLPAGSRSFFDAQKLKAAEARLPPAGQKPEADEAGADLAHTSDDSALAFAQRYRGGLFAVDEVVEERSPGQKPSATYARFVGRLEARRRRSCAADPVYKETFREALAQAKISFIDAAGKEELYTGARDVVAEDRLCLGALPPDVRSRLVSQFLSIVAKPRPGGGYSILEPRTPAAGEGTSHVDAARATVTALWRVGSCEPRTWRPKPDIPRQRGALGPTYAEREGYARPGTDDDWR